MGIKGLPFALFMFRKGMKVQVLCYSTHPLHQMPVAQPGNVRIYFLIHMTMDRKGVCVTLFEPVVFGCSFPHLLSVS